MTFWQKNGGDPQALPFQDVGPGGIILTDLANNPGSAQLCGWSQAPALPAFDPTTQQCAWANGAWVVSNLPEPPPDTSARWLTLYDFYQRFQATERQGIWASTDAVVVDFVKVLDALPRSGPAVYLDDPQTGQGLAYLESKGLIGSGRAAEILA